MLQSDATSLLAPASAERAPVPLPTARFERAVTGAHDPRLGQLREFAEKANEAAPLRGVPHVVEGDARGMTTAGLLFCRSENLKV
jgi:hypothetical protein